MRDKQVLIAGISMILLVGGLYWWQGKTEQASTPKMVVVGVIALTEVDASTLQGFKEGMSALGYIEGTNIRYLAEGPARTIDRLDGIISRVLAQNVDLIFVSSTPATLKVQQATLNTPLPVIFDPVNDPVRAGIVTSLKHPGANITGIKLPTGEKLRLQWLTELAPAAKRIYFPYNPEDKSALTSLAQIEEALPLLGLELVKEPMSSPEEIMRDINNAPEGIDAIFLPRDSSIEAQIDQFVALSHQRKLPLSAPSLTQVESGALYTYGFIHYEFGKQAARLADQIFNGIHPSDIPVEVAESYLAININSAQAIGVPLSDEMLRKADRIIR